VRVVTVVTCLKGTGPTHVRILVQPPARRTGAQELPPVQGTTARYEVGLRVQPSAGEGEQPARSSGTCRHRQRFVHFV